MGGMKRCENDGKVGGDEGEIKVPMGEICQIGILEEERLERLLPLGLSSTNHRSSK